MTTDEVARYLGITHNGVTNAAKRGVLKGEKIAGRWDFEREDVEKYLRDHRGRQGQVTPEVARSRADRASRTTRERYDVAAKIDDLNNRLSTLFDFETNWRERMAELNQGTSDLPTHRASGPAAPRDPSADIADLRARVESLERRMGQLAKIAEVLQS